MLDVKALRVGNWVYAGNKGEVQVTVALLQSIQNISEFVHPIKFTDEWRQRLDVDYWLGNAFGFRIKLIKNSRSQGFELTFYSPEHIEYNDIEILYVHQLQNIVYSLLDIELVAKAKSPLI